MPNNLSFQNNSWVLTGSYSVPTNFMDGFFGNGSDGDITVTGIYTPTKETYFNNLTIQGTGSVKPNGFRILVRNTLTINSGCSINDDGNDSTGSNGGVGLASRNYLGAYGSAGGAGSTTGTGSNGVTVTGQGLAVYNNSGVSPIGGSGGRYSAGLGVVGAGGTYGALTAGQNLWSSWLLGRAAAGSVGASNTQSWTCGSGGGGGAALSGSGAIGGGGGGGAGMVWLAAKNIINNGRISANGGTGGPATGPSDAGSGGGGGGGIIIIITNTPVSSTGIVQANGGSAGSTVSGAGTTGSAGTSGPICIISFGGN